MQSNKLEGSAAHVWRGKILISSASLLELGERFRVEGEARLLVYFQSSSIRNKILSLVPRFKFLPFLHFLLLAHLTMFMMLAKKQRSHLTRHTDCERLSLSLSMVTGGVLLEDIVAARGKYRYPMN